MLGWSSLPRDNIIFLHMLVQLFQLDKHWEKNYVIKENINIYFCP